MYANLLVRNIFVFRDNFDQKKHVVEKITDVYFFKLFVVNKQTNNETRNRNKQKKEIPCQLRLGGHFI